MPLTDKGVAAAAGCIIGDPTPIYNAANARVGIGDSSTAFDVTQTDLQAATNKFRKLVDSAPIRTANAMEFTSIFTASEANFAWNEMAVFNSSSGDSMLTRRTISLGTKTSLDAWTITAVVILSPTV